MGTEITCDICKRPTEAIVGKLFFAPTTRARGAKAFHNNYELHLDVGSCCEAKLKKGFRWRQRMSAEQYAETRRLRRAG